MRWWEGFVRWWFEITASRGSSLCYLEVALLPCESHFPSKHAATGRRLPQIRRELELCLHMCTTLHTTSWMSVTAVHWLCSELDVLKRIS
jgi:hypothetical protein